MKNSQNYLQSKAKLAYDRLLAAFNFKTICFNSDFRKRWGISTPYISVDFTKQTPFSDWRFDLDIGLVFWIYSLNIDNMYKYYPKYEKT